MKCRLTGSEGKPVDAHIIPRSFFRIDAAAPSMLIQSEAAHYPKRSQIGIYDSSILTAEGEQKFSLFDTHASAVLIRGISDIKPLNADSPPLGFTLQEFDYALLKLFFISLLWRASVSNHTFFSRVNLGPKLEERAKEMILGADPGDPHEFAVVLGVFHDKIQEGFGILDPIRTRMNGLNCYLFYLNHMIAYIKADSQPCSDSWSGFIVQPDKPLFFVNRGEFRRSKEYPVMRSAALKNQDFLPKWWKESANKRSWQRRPLRGHRASLKSFAKNMKPIVCLAILVCSLSRSIAEEVRDLSAQEPNIRPAGDVVLKFERHVPIPEIQRLDENGVLEIFPGDTVHLEFQEIDGRLSQPKVVAGNQHPERTISFKMTQDASITMLTRKTDIKQTVSMECLHRDIGSDEFFPTNLRPTEKGLAIFDSWPNSVWMLRLSNIQASTKPADEVYQEMVSKSQEP